MRYFFIDLENVRSAGLEGVLSLADDDTVYIFYSDNAYNLTIPTLESINNSKATVRFIKINYLGANAMDFQIVSLFGAMIERQKKGFFYIISHDNGFRSAINFCTSYFESYDIHLGEYDNIISALTAELKSRAPKSAAKESGASDGEHKKSRRRRGKRGPADTTATADEPTAASGDSSEQTVEEPESTETDSTETDSTVSDSTEGSDMLQASVESQQDSDSDDGQAHNGAGESTGRRRRSRNRHRGRKKPEQQENAAEQQDEEADCQSEASEEKPARRGNTADRTYIYAALKGLLSEKTISIYADSIHEAIGASKNRDELHRFFHKRYGADEGEALYRVIQSDFDKLKSQRS